VPYPSKERGGGRYSSLSLGGHVPRCVCDAWPVRRKIYTVKPTFSPYSFGLTAPTHERIARPGPVAHPSTNRARRSTTADRFSSRKISDHYTPLRSVVRTRSRMAPTLYRTLWLPVRMPRRK